ncbi:MAG: sigma-54 dependent transcriptional regulator [Spirosomataceae bacterium]
MKILISWYAKNNDFGTDGTINLKGPTIQFHQHFYQHDQHILLSSRSEEDGDPFLSKLIAELTKTYKGRIIVPKFMNLVDVIDFQAIKGKVEKLLLEYRNDDIDIFFSPGTSAMQLSWYACHTTLVLNTRLLQTREGKFTGKTVPDLIELTVETSSIPLSVVISEQKQSESTEDYLLTESIQPIYQKAKLVANAERVTCLIRGESGTGKEHLANYIHKNSARKDHPFIAINCSAIGDSLLESRLFGHIKGAFTDAKEDKKGLFEEANGGTIFLDEIGDVSPHMQQSLLRVLQEGEISPIGSTKTKKLDVRIIAATHKPLETLCEKNEFRWDLYYRLSVVELLLPTLQERGETERRNLITFFLTKIQQEFKKQKPLKIEKSALDLLLSYPFAGNIRELENVITNLYVFCEENVTTNELPIKFRTQKKKEAQSFNWKEVEKNLIKEALAHYRGNQRQTSLAIGYGSLNTFKKKMKEYGIE